MLYEDEFNHMIEIVDGFFARDFTPVQARKEFAAFRNDSLAKVPEFAAELLEGYPHLAAVSFLGMVQFVEGAAFEEFKGNPSQESLTKLIAASGLQIRKSAHPSWEFLRKDHPAAALTVIVLCVLSIRNKTVANALSPFEPLAKATPHAHVGHPSHS
jgi:hypothetical protein